MFSGRLSDGGVTKTFNTSGPTFEPYGHKFSFNMTYIYSVFSVRREVSEVTAGSEVTSWVCQFVQRHGIMESCALDSLRKRQ